MYSNIHVYIIILYICFKNTVSYFISYSFKGLFYYLTFKKSILFVELFDSLYIQKYEAEEVLYGAGIAD